MCDDIEQLIEVKRPYFSLNDFMVSDEGVTATLEREQPMENERGCMAAAEVGRHLAILGSCALAIKNPIKSKHYYLAHRAKLTRIFDPDTVGAINLKADSYTTYLDKRKGEAHSKLYSDEKHIFDLKVEYHIIKEQIFHKLYKDKVVDYEPGLNSPYAEVYKLEDIKYKFNKLEAKLGPLTPQQCSGHFDKIPCLPVAVLMHALSRSAGKLLCHQVGNDTTYKVYSADIHAENLAFSGDIVLIHIEFTGSRDGVYSYNCKAGNSRGENYGRMELKLIPDIT